jgi:predicted CXXCH cytochrome family protein
MVIPDELPLQDGKIACRTCHTAHASTEEETLATAVFLRVRNDAGQLCQSCHKDHTLGPQEGAHPIGGMPWAIPNELIIAGAKPPPDNRTLTCQVCHMPHGSKQEHLLVMGTGSNQLCLTCHQELRPGMFRHDRPTDHPSNPLIQDPHQLDFIKKMGTAIGDQGRLICLSCHKVHHGKGRRFLLADDLAGGKFCINCHSNKASVTGSPHDLTVAAPDERNRLGMLPTASGSCGACHLFHDFARSVQPTPLDPAGHCVTCHQPDQCAANALTGQWGHPVNVSLTAGMPTGLLPLLSSKNADGVENNVVTCITCHDPHSNDQTHPKFLRNAAKPSELCITCHSEMKSLTGGPHDALTPSVKWDGSNPGEQDLCLSCHLPHSSDPTRKEWAKAPANGQPISDGVCLGCHAEAGWDGHGNLLTLHPRSQTSLDRTGHLPLLPSLEDATVGRIGCKTCHDPHKAHSNNPLLRILPGNDPASLCATCHDEKRHIRLTGHGSPIFQNLYPKSEGTCAPCHTNHASPAKLQSPLQTFLRTLPNKTSVDEHCWVCHGPRGTGPTVDVPQHSSIPQVMSEGHTQIMTSLFSGKRKETFQTIACSACHSPHGNLQVFQTLEKSIIEALGPRESRALKSTLKPGLEKNLCSHCHGFDAIRRFLYFHRPDKRTGPIGLSPLGEPWPE